GGALELLDPVGRAREPEQSRLVLQGVVELVDGAAAFTQKVQEGARIDRAGTRCHRDSLERREPHGRVDRPPVADGGDRATAAQVADDQAGGGYALGSPLHREPVKAETADSGVVPE